VATTTMTCHKGLTVVVAISEGERWCYLRQTITEVARSFVKH
jgi:hypothetical protein